jgi:neutral amino acid transport system ATP-binding protein
VMAEGSIVAEGPHASVVADPRVIDAYLGAHHDAALDRAEQERRLAESQAKVDAEIEAERAKVEEL